MWYSAYGRSQADKPMEGKRGWEANSHDKVTTLKTKTDIITITVQHYLMYLQLNVTFFPNLKMHFKIQDFSLTVQWRISTQIKHALLSGKWLLFWETTWCFCHVSVKCTSKRARELEYFKSSKIPLTCVFPGHFASVRNVERISYCRTLKSRVCFFHRVIFNTKRGCWMRRNPTT